MKVPKKASTQGFYNDLEAGAQTRGMWGKESRFSPEKICQKPLVRETLIPLMQTYLTNEDEVLDLGCGPGTFFPLLSPCCKSLTGADIVPGFVESAQRLIHSSHLENTSVQLIGDPLPFEDESFSVIIMIDTIHHLETIDSVIQEAHRVLRPGGLLLILEPNRNNPLLYLMCFLDRNERGLLTLGTHKHYQGILAGRFTVEETAWSSMLIGPDARWMVSLARFLSHGLGGRLRWLSPKVFLAARKVTLHE